MTTSLRPLGKPRGCIPSVCLCAFVALTATARAQVDFEREPILYEQTASHDDVAELQRKLADGTATLDYDESHGYLPAVLKALGVKTSSQVLVHSKTSFQLRRISPRKPRAVYFNDRSYVGWVQDGDVVEVMSTDPDLGEVFYTLSQEQADKPEFVRDRGNCMVCHASSRTQDVPGVVVRSAFVDRGGQPHYGSRTFVTDHTSPFDQRWGGWYVTGTHGAMRHMGNVFAERSNPEGVDREPGANLAELSKLFDVAPYLAPHSDVVALMVLEHQSQTQNFLTRAAYEARTAAHQDAVMNRALDRPADHVSESTGRRVVAAAEDVVRHLLFTDEFRLTDPVRGTSKFAEEFASVGPRDSQGRSLRDFDLKTRLFRHPCSYLVYSPSFDALPETVRTQVAKRLHEVLTGDDESRAFAHLSADDRRAIREILTETKPGLWPAE